MKYDMQSLNFENWRAFFFATPFCADLLNFDFSINERGGGVHGFVFAHPGPNLTYV